MRNFLLILMVFVFSFNLAKASSHRDSNFLTLNPALDGTDLYAFTSYEAGREDFITIIANYHPLATSVQGPEYYSFDPTALYEIFIDTDGNAIEDHSFRFRFSQNLKNNGAGLSATVANQILSFPFINNGDFSEIDNGNLARNFSYKIEYIKDKAAYKYKNIENIPIKGDAITNSTDAKKIFAIPETDIGSNSIADYDSYASSFIYEIKIPDKKCKTDARVFVGPRKDSFKANISGIYDLANKNLQGSENGSVNEFDSNNVLSIALEIPKACLNINEENPVIGIWSTSSSPARKIIKNRPSFSGFSLFSKQAYVQSSRLTNPFVSLFMIGYKDKDLFNATRPSKDLTRDFDNYLLYPVLAEFIEANSNLTAPNLFPRTDLEEILLTGVDGLNSTESLKKFKAAEILRLNITTSPVAKGSQNRLGLLAADQAGYPNGRRPGDDVSDIFFRLIFGARISDDSLAPSGDLSLTDGVSLSDQDFNNSFPYLVSP